MSTDIPSGNAAPVADSQWFDLFWPPDVSDCQTVIVVGGWTHYFLSPTRQVRFNGDRWQALRQPQPRIDHTSARIVRRSPRRA